MTRSLVAGLALLVVCPPVSEAHELDEYLQASRISLERDRVTCEVDLTPGAELVEAVLALIDRDGDRRLTPSEAESYGSAVLRDLTLELDGHPLDLMLERVEAPSVEEMMDGVGTIRIRAAVDPGPLRAGRHRLHFRNDHRPDGGVYLANALVPGDRSISVAGQSRDPRQREIRVEYDIGSERPLRTAWLLAAGCVLGALVVSRRGGKNRL
jgi:hypothetical protein